jgi:hypothetical protein
MEEAPIADSSTSPIADSSTSPVAPKYGPVAEGGYDTPYAVTIFYSETDLYQAGAAVLATQSQPIPINGADLLTLGDVCEHPSPDLVLFANVKYTPDCFAAYFRRGFQRILIVIEDIDGSTYGSTHAFDTRIKVISYKELFTGYVAPIDSLNAFYIMELVTCAKYSDYQPGFRGITHEEGKLFCAYIARTFEKNSARELFRLGVSFNGNEIAVKYCERELGIRAERTKLAMCRLELSPVRNEITFVYGGDLRNELITAALASSRPYIAIVWGEAGDNTTITKVSLFANKNATLSSRVKLAELTLAAITGESPATCLIPDTDLVRFRTF